MKLATRRYAKRQLTWFRHETGARTVYADTEDARLKSAEEMLAEATEIAEEFIREFEQMKGDR